MNRFTAIVLTLLTASGTALSQRGMDMRGADIKDAGDVQSASLTLGGDTIMVWPDSVGALTNVTTDATMTGTGKTNDPLAVATSIVSGAAAGTTASQPGHGHSYEAITNAPWITEYIQAIVAAGGDATLNVVTNGTEITYTVTVDFLDWVLEDDPAYLAAFTNLFEGAGISITGTGRSRTIESTITQYEDTDAVSAIKADADWKATQWDEAYGWGDHDGLYLGIDATADAAEKLVSADGLTWLVMASQTGTLYWVGEGADTNTVVVTGTLNPDATGEYLIAGEKNAAPYWVRLDGAEVYFTGGAAFDWEIGSAEWSFNQGWTRDGAGFGDDPLDFLLGEYVPGAGSTGTATVSYGTIPVTNSVALATAESVAAAIAALNLGSMSQEDAGDYYDKTEVDGKVLTAGTASTNYTDSAVTAATNALSPVASSGAYGDLTGTPTIPDITAASITPTAVTNDWLYLANGAWQSLDSSGATTNSLSIEPGLATGIDFIRLDVRWDGVSTIEWPTTNLVTYLDDFVMSSNVTSVVVFDSANWSTNWTAHQFPKEVE